MKTTKTNMPSIYGDFKECKKMKMNIDADPLTFYLHQDMTSAIGRQACSAELSSPSFAHDPKVGCIRGCCQRFAENGFPWFHKSGLNGSNPWIASR